MFKVVSFLVVVFGVFLGLHATKFAGNVFSNHVAPAVNAVAEFFEPEYSWEKPNASKENDAKEMVLKLVPGALYSWGKTSVEGLPIEYAGTQELRTFNTVNGKVSRRINLFEEIKDKNLPIMYARYMETKEKKSSPNMREVIMKVYVAKDKSDYPSMMEFAVSVAFTVGDDDIWIPKNIYAYSFGHSSTRAREHLASSTPDMLSTVYVSQYLLDNKVFSNEGSINYEEDSKYMSHLRFNSRIF
ncbi:hypothetical protein [Cellvibrio sp. QJXJ]|uniref:hypothetical protein n=1 Tax=Cellvibrio sp. QJXJ TaxID=2964606 RepID=UPI0021C35D16|nr:hypothetical protein [Cellvibrio sp. QJXJ]UUA75132.1 hypothetical protein NNX04_22000 [Cellvibrio sp. QJXJ]